MILGGWQISGVWEARSGLPLLIRQSTGGPGQRPDIVASSHEAAAFDNYSEPLTNGTYQYLDRAAFAPIALNDSRTRAVRAGNLSRNAIYGPGRWGVDLALSKSFQFNERHRLRFQAEWFNATNHTNFSGIQTDVLSSAFGRVTSTEPGRVTQLSVRYEF
jgi:hypothetical protein